MTKLYDSFITSCVSADGEAISAMTARAISVSYRTFASKLGRKAIKELSSRFGYDKDLKLKDDWAVSFHRSKYLGERVYYLQHSRIEYVFGAAS
ncbi:hypothetical protein D3C85_787780 [compost metagenome]